MGTAKEKTNPCQQHKETEGRGEKKKKKKGGDGLFIRVSKPETAEGKKGRGGLVNPVQLRQEKKARTASQRLWS